MDRQTKTARLFAMSLCMAAPAALLASTARADEPISIAVLSAQMQNDHQEWVPTKDDERARMQKVTDTFKSMLEQSGKYKFKDVSPEIQAEIGKDQKMGECANCEVQYGKEIGVHQVAWINVQKVSELILNMNVYVKDVDSGKMAFEKSVDLRGNNDESWQHSMKYLIKHYMLPAGQQNAERPQG